MYTFANIVNLAIRQIGKQPRNDTRTVSDISHASSHKHTHTHTQARSQINYPMAILPCTRMRYTLCARISLTSSLSCSRVQNVEGVCTFYTCTPLDRPASVFFDQEYNTLRSSGAKTSLLDLVMGPRNWFEVFVESRRVRVEGTRGGGRAQPTGGKPEAAVIHRHLATFLAAEFSFMSCHVIIFGKRNKSLILMTLISRTRFLRQRVCLLCLCTCVCVCITCIS